MIQFSLNLLLLVVSIGLLWKGAEWLVESAARIGRRFNISDLTIGLTVVAFGTSAPEFAVTISAAIAEKSNISVGNVVGSNIFNLGFILGGCALFSPLKTTRTVVYRDGLVLVVTALLLVVLLYDYRLSRWEGLLLFAGLIAYVTSLFLSKNPPTEDLPSGKASWKDVPLLFIGIVSVVGGGHLLVESASQIAKFFGLSDWLIAVTIVAAGTSAPEFATSLMAAAKGRHGMSLGNLVGSDLFNLMGVLGLAGIIRNMSISGESLSSVVGLALMCLITAIFMRTGWVVSRREGGILVSIGIARWIIDFL